MPQLKLKCVIDGGVVESRRYPEVDYASSFARLEATIRSSGLVGKLSEYKIMYEDDDGDLVTVRSDAELLASFGARPAPATQRSSVTFLVEVKSLKTTARGDQVLLRCRRGGQSRRLLRELEVGAATLGSEGLSSAPSRGGPCSSPAARGVEQRHVGIVCDGCGATPIVGPRFKCTVRPNFDLCASCRVADGPKHPMAQVAAPHPWCAAAAALHEAVTAAADVHESKAVEDVVAEHDLVEKSLKDTTTQVQDQAEPEGATQANVDALKIATMASLETMAREDASRAESAATDVPGRQRQQQQQQQHSKVLTEEEEGGSGEEKDDSAPPWSDAEYDKLDEFVGSGGEPIAPWTAVELVGLTNEKFLGERGVLMASAGRGDDRVLVKLDGTGEVVAVKRSNLGKAGRGDAAPPPVSPEDKWKSQLAQLTEMGFTALLGVPACVDLLQVHDRRGTLDTMDRVVADIIQRFDAA